MQTQKPTKATPDRVIVGRFGRVHGIKGFISLQSFTQPAANILSYDNWLMYLDQKWQPVECLAVEQTHKGILVLVKGYEQRELAMRLTQAEIAVSRDVLPEPEPGEYYWHDLLGVKVENLQGQDFGTLVDIMPTGANDVLVVEGEKKHLIPYLPGQVVIEVDLVQRLMRVDWDPDF